MKNRKLLIGIVGTLCVLTVACGKEDVNEKEMVSVDIETMSSVSEESQEIVTNEDTVSEEVNMSMAEDTQKSYYVSEREVCEDRESFPEGVCTDFSYFVYGGNEEAPYEAQKYLEEIGVSEENKKLVIRLANQDGENPTELIFYEYRFDDSGAKRREHYFFSNAKTYRESVASLNTIKEKSDTALYIQTEFYDVLTMTYERVIQLGESELYDILW